MTISSFFAMGGYAVYIWPSYALAAVVMVGLLVVSRRGWLANEAALKTLQESRPGRRRRRRAAAEEPVEAVAEEIEVASRDA